MKIDKTGGELINKKSHIRTVEGKKIRKRTEKQQKSMLCKFLLWDATIFLNKKTNNFFVHEDVRKLPSKVAYFSLIWASFRKKWLTARLIYNDFVVRSGWRVCGYHNNSRIKKRSICYWQNRRGGWIYVGFSLWH